jgi:hypothetical protein
LSQQYSIETENQSGVTVFLLKNAGVASAKVIPEWGNNCFEFRTTHSVFEEVPFDQIQQTPGSYKTLYLPFRIGSKTVDFHFEE